MPSVDDIPRINTPAGGWHDEMPGPFLVGCDDAIAPGAPDLRGTWCATEVTVGGQPAPHDHPMRSHVERIEQAGRRVTLTSGGIIHDFPVVDGSFENGCHDVAAFDYATPIVVAASFEDRVLVLRPRDMPGVEVRRWLDGDELVWDYHGAFTVRMSRREGL